jgi:hypothetical protein
MSRARARRRRSLLAPLVSLAVALGLVVLPAPGAQAATATSVSMTLSRPYGVFWDGVGPSIPEDTFFVRGRLTAAGEGLGSRTVTLLRRMKNGSELRPVRTTTTDAQGYYSFGRKVEGTAFYRVDFAGEELMYDAASSEVEKLPGLRDFNAVKRRVDGRLYFRGNINPLWENRTIYLTRKRCGSCAWRTVATKQTGPSGGWSFRVTYPDRVGPVWTWQAVIRAGGNFERSYSAMLTTQRVYGR